MARKVFIIAFIVLWSLAAGAAAQKKTGTLKGKVEDEKGKPVAGAEIRVMNTRTREVKETKTDEAGDYSLELEPDHYVVSFDAEGLQGVTLTSMQQVEEGKETRVRTMELEKAKKPTSLIRGVVFTIEGFSLPGATVKLKRIPTEEEEQAGKKVKSLKIEYKTNRRGEFAFRIPSQQARYELTASRDGFKSQMKRIYVGENESVPVAFSLEPVKK
ncbi:MAG: carboxypeptidase-like regulatory domain-containing protein [Blastocatellia bacterium]|nr:carboxypeptidase-like regulatory domain-containing protein [Blastocatellia bacterium]